MPIYGATIFKQGMEGWSKQVDADLAKIIRYVALFLYNEITSRNPVDTGYSQSQWRLALDAPDLSVDAPPDRKNKGAAVIPIPPPDAAVLTDITARSVVFLTNSVNYIQYLEDGSSKQAASGFIRVSLAEVSANLEVEMSKLGIG